MRTSIAVFATIVALSLTGCATQFSDTASAPDGSVYVVGGRAAPFVGMRPAMWKCPASPGGGRCVRVEVKQ
jgi:hypothetical protein